MPITDSPVTNRLFLGIQNLWMLTVIIVQTVNLSNLIYLGALRKFCCHTKPESSSSLTVAEKVTRKKRKKSNFYFELIHYHKICFIMTAALGQRPENVTRITVSYTKIRIELHDKISS